MLAAGEAADATTGSAGVAGVVALEAELSCADGCALPRSSLLIAEAKLVTAFVIASALYVSTGSFIVRPGCEASQSMKGVHIAFEFPIITASALPLRPKLGRGASEKAAPPTWASSVARPLLRM